MMMRNAVIPRPSSAGGSTTADATASPSTASIDDAPRHRSMTCSPGAGTPPSDRGMNVPTVSPALFQSRAEHLRRLIDAHLAREPDAAVGQEDRARRRALELVGDAADQLGDDVLERDQSLDADRRSPTTSTWWMRLLAHVGEQLIGGEAVVHARDRAQQRRQRRLPARR